MQVEIHALAFAYNTSDQLQDATLYAYRVINRGLNSLDDVHIGIWADPDLGCALDDYIGYMPEQDMAYVYNADAHDDDCGVGGAGYGNDIPAAGIAWLKLPTQHCEKNAIRSFTYYNEQNPPYTDIHYYNLLRGRHMNGAPMTWGGTGYNPGSTDTTHTAFPGAPTDSVGWSMCTENIIPNDWQFVLAAGPVSLSPGAVNNFAFSTVWAREMDYPCPNLVTLRNASERAKWLYEGCIDYVGSPNAPDIDIIELDQELIIVLSNKDFLNNFQEDYVGIDGPSLAPYPEGVYHFEGYKIYQLVNPHVDAKHFDNPDSARLVAQSDINNGIGLIANWEPEPYNSANGKRVYSPITMVDGADEGIQYTYRVTKDMFADNQNNALVNHKKYYYNAVVYAYNNYEKFDPITESGQQRPYLQSKYNHKVAFTGVPRPALYQNTAGKYGDQIAISRLDGVGTGPYFLDLTSETIQQITENAFDGTLHYKPGNGPFEVKTINPYALKNGKYQLELFDNTVQGDSLTDSTFWRLTFLEDGSEVISTHPITYVREHVFPQYGFSITFRPSVEPGQLVQNNGFVGTRVQYKDPTGAEWFSWIQDDIGEPFNFVKTRNSEPDHNLDPKEDFTVPEKVLLYRIIYAITEMIRYSASALSRLRGHILIRHLVISCATTVACTN